MINVCMNKNIICIFLARNEDNFRTCFLFSWICACTCVDVGALVTGVSAYNGTIIGAFGWTPCIFWQCYRLLTIIQLFPIHHLNFNIFPVTTPTFSLSQPSLTPCHNVHLLPVTTFTYSQTLPSLTFCHNSPTSCHNPHLLPVTTLTYSLSQSSPSPCHNPHLIPVTTLTYSLSQPSLTPCHNIHLLPDSTLTYVLS